MARGASAGKEDVHSAIKNIDKGLYPKAFCKILPDYGVGDPAFCSLMHADGAGTKSALAWAYWRETGDLSVWKGIAQDAIVMNTDDLLCVGSTGPIMYSSTIGRNKKLVPATVLKALIEGGEEVLAMLNDMGMEIIACGGETADLGDLVRTIVVDSTVYARMPRKAVIDNANIRPGLVIIGLAAGGGQANYETAYNSGIGSNGLTSARHELLSKAAMAAYPESKDPAMADSLAYSGPFAMRDTLPGTDMEVAKAILSPTRTYAPVMVQLLREQKHQIAGAIHCSGGGQTKVLHFIDQGQLTIVKENLFNLLPIFNQIQNVSGTTWAEMYKVYNMGHRMELYVQAEAAAEIIAMSEAQGVPAKVIGHTKPFNGRRLEIAGPEGLLSWE